jgi:hypothetical protein
MQLSITDEQMTKALRYAADGIEEHPKQHRLESYFLVEDDTSYDEQYLPDAISMMAAGVPCGTAACNLGWIAAGLIQQGVDLSEVGDWTELQVGLADAFEPVATANGQNIFGATPWNWPEERHAGDPHGTAAAWLRDIADEIEYPNNEGEQS